MRAEFNKVIRINPSLLLDVHPSPVGGGFGRAVFSLNEKVVNGGHAPFNHGGQVVEKIDATHHEIVFQVRVPVPMETGLAPALTPRSGPSGSCVPSTLPLVSRDIA